MSTDESSGPARVAVLVSGSGTNLQALIDAMQAGTVAGRIVAVLSDRADARGLQRAHAAGIEAGHVAVARTATPGYDAGLIAALEALGPDLIVLAGYMRILSADTVAAFSDRIFNLHPSLLPRYPGVDTHARVLAAGDARHGATVHFVTAELDAGPRIIQYRIEVRDDDTPQSLAARVHAGEHIILPRAVDLFARGRLRLVADRVMLDGNPMPEPLVVEGTS